MLTARLCPVLALLLAGLLLFRPARGSAGDTCDIKDSSNNCEGAAKRAEDKYSEEVNTKVSWKRFADALAEARRSEATGSEDCANDSDTCRCYAPLIAADLAPFPSVSRADLSAIHAVHQHAVTYQLVGGRVFRSRECLFPFRCKGVEHFLTRLAKDLPDTELAVNMHDWPYISKHFGRSRGEEPRPLPLFSFSKTQHYWDIAFPAWTFWAGGPAISLYPTGLGRWDLLRESLRKASEETPWEKKSDVAFFRGSRTSAERDNLVRLSRKKPGLVDAAYTKNQAWKSPADTLGKEPASEVSLEAHCRHKLLFNFRGVAASFRFKHLFLCGSAVLHVGDEWTEFFYPLMRPWVHYVPVDAKASERELEELLGFLRSVPAEVEAIAERGKAFIERNLRMEDVECYWRRVLQEYTERLDFEPVRNEDFIEITD